MLFFNNQCHPYSLKYVCSSANMQTRTGAIPMGFCSLAFTHTRARTNIHKFQDDRFFFSVTACWNAICLWWDVSVLSVQNERSNDEDSSPWMALWDGTALDPLLYLYPKDKLLLYKAIIEWQSLDYRGICLRSLLELLQGQLPISIFIHHGKNAIHSLLWRVFFFWKVHCVSHHLIDCIYDIEHFITCDIAIVIKIIKLECP